MAFIDVSVFLPASQKPTPGKPQTDTRTKMEGNYAGSKNIPNACLHDAMVCARNPREDFTVIRAVLAVIALCAVPIAGFSEEYCRETDDHGECLLREEERTRDFVREARIGACRQLATKAHQATGTDEPAAILGAMNSHCAGRTAPRGQCGAWTLTEDCPRTSPGGDSTS
ncbi:MAG: hypothetical protein OXF33_00695 [Rhodospirillales bacterium]|nr:hypothetical protein [Rhodospirillales bacterium]